LPLLPFLYNLEDLETSPLGINTIKGNTEAALTDANKEVGLEVNAEKTKLSCHQNAGQSYNRKTASRSLKIFDSWQGQDLFFSSP
jgi:hypothetical protein